MRSKLLVLFSVVAISITVCLGDDVDICRSCENIVRAKQADRRFLWFGSSSKATAKSRRSTDASDDNFISPGPLMTSWLELCRCVCNLRQEHSDTDLQQRIHTFLSEYNLAGREDTLLTSFRRRVLLHRCKSAVGNQPTGRMESHAQTLPALLPESMRDRPSTLSRSMPQKEAHAQILPSLLPESMRKRPSNFSRSNPERLPHAQTLPALLPESMRTRPSPLSRSIPDVEPALLPESIRNRPSSLNPENDAGLSNQQNPNTPSQEISPTQHTEYDLVSQQYTVSPDQSTQNKLNRTRSIRKKKKPHGTQTPSQGQTDLPTPEAPHIYALLSSSVPLNYESAPQTGKIGSDETNRRTFNRPTPPSNQGTLQVFYGVPEDAHRPSRLHGRISSLLSQRIQSLIKGSRSLGDSSTQPEPTVSAFASGHNTAISVQRGGDASAVISNGQENPFSYHITATTTATPLSGHHAKHHHYQAYAHEGSHPSGIIIQGKNSAAAAFSDNIANAVERNNNQHSEITVQGKNSAAAAFSDTTADAAEGNNNHPSAIVVQGEHSAAAASSGNAPGAAEIAVQGKNSVAAALSDNTADAAEGNSNQPSAIVVQGEQSAAAAIGDSVAVGKSSGMETSTQPPTRTGGKYFGNPMAGAGSDMSNDKGRTYNFVYGGDEDDGADDYIDEDVMYADSEVPTTAAVDNVMTVAEAYQEPEHLPMDPSPSARVAEPNLSPDVIANSSSVPPEKEEIYDWYSQVLKALSNYNLVVVTLLQNMLGGLRLAYASSLTTDERI